MVDEERPTHTPEGKEITYYRAESKKPSVTGYSIIDPKTDKAIGEIAAVDIGRFSQPTTTYRGKGMTFRKLEPTPEVAAKIERREEKGYEKEMAQKEAEYEAKRIEEGKIKVEDVVLTQEGAREILQKRLEKAAEERAKFPTKEEPKILTREEVTKSLFERQAGLRLRERKDKAKAVVTEEGFIIAPPSATIYKKEIPIIRERKELFERREPIKVLGKEVEKDDSVPISISDGIPDRISDIPMRTDLVYQAYAPTPKEKIKIIKETTDKPATRILTGMGLMGGYYVGGIIKGVTAPFRPKFYKEEIPSMFRFLTAPFRGEYAPEVGQALWQQPEKVIGEMAGYQKGFKILGKAAPKIKYEKLKVPTKKGEVTIYKGITIEKGARGRPLIGVSEGKIKVGTPDITLKKVYLEKGLLVETPAQTAIIRKTITKAYPKIEVAKFEKGLYVMRATETTPSIFVQKRFIAEAKALPPKGVREVIKFAKKENAQVYGSYGARQQMPTDLARLPADIDIQLKVGAAGAATKASQLVSKLKKMGVEARISKQSPTLIETKVAGKWHHAVDIHSIEPSPADISPAIARERIYGLRLGQKPIKIEKIEVMPLSEQAMRKGGSILTMREKGFAPAAHRMKDIPDWFAAEEALIRSKLFGKTKLTKTLAETKALYPQELFKTEVTPRVPLYIPKKAIVKPSIPIVSPFLVTPSIKAYPIIPKPSYISIPPSVPPSPRYIIPSPKPSPPPSPRYVISPSLFRPSPRPSITPSPKPSPRPSPPSAPPSVSPSISPTPSPPPSPSILISPSPKPSPKPSPPSIPPSITPSISPSPKPSPYVYPKPSPKPSPPPPLISKPSPSLSKFPSVPPTDKQGFDVMVREGEARSDRFKKVAEGLPRRKALRKGAEITDRYIEATFRIQRSKKRVREQDLISEPDLSKFRPPAPKSKLPRDSLIELTKHRIDSLQEKQQLSYFKEQAKKKKAERLRGQINFLSTQQKKQKKKAQLRQEINILKSNQKSQEINFFKSTKSNKKKQKRIKFL